MALIETLATLLERLLVALGGLGIFIVVVGGVYLLGRLVAVPALRALTDALDIEETLKHTLLKVTGGGFALLGIYLALPLSGLATTPSTVAAITAGATIAIGFASRDLLSNLVSGAILVVDPEFHIGDWIEWDGKAGIIEGIDFRVTRVHTFDNEVITVPNSQLTASAVTNPASKDRRRLRYTFPIGYEEDLETAREVILEVTRQHADVLDRPAPRILVTELGDSAVELEVFFWVAEPARAETQRIRAEFVERVKMALDDADVEMPYPTRALTGEVAVSGDGDRFMPGDRPGAGPNE